MLYSLRGRLINLRSDSLQFSCTSVAANGDGLGSGSKLIIPRDTACLRCSQEYIRHVSNCSIVVFSKKKLKTPFVVQNMVEPQATLICVSYEGYQNPPSFQQKTQA